MDNKSLYLLRFLVLTFVLGVQSCNLDSTAAFIVSQQQNSIQSNKQGKFYYSAFNFILDSSDRLFFHRKDSLLNCCDTGADPNFPDYIGLRPADLFIYNKSNFSRFVDSVSKLPKEVSNSIQIAVLFDTVRSKRFLDLKGTLKQKNFANYSVRLATEEEREVLKAKVENRPYDFYKVKWTSRFSHTLFLPPVTDSSK